MLRVKSARVCSKRILKGALRWLAERGGGDSASMPLFPALSDPESFLVFQILYGPEFSLYKPADLCQKSQQK